MRAGHRYPNTRTLVSEIKPCAENSRLRGECSTTGHCAAWHSACGTLLLLHLLLHFLDFGHALEIEQINLEQQSRIGGDLVALGFRAVAELG